MAIAKTSVSPRNPAITVVGPALALKRLFDWTEAAWGQGVGMVSCIDHRC